MSPMQWCVIILCVCRLHFTFMNCHMSDRKKIFADSSQSILQQPVLQSASDVSECVSLRTNENNWLKFANVAFHAAPAAWDSQTGYFQGTILQLFCSKPNRVLIVFSCFLFRICLVSLLMQTDDRIVNIISFDLIWFALLHFYVSCRQYFSGWQWHLTVNFRHFQQTVILFLFLTACTHCFFYFTQL